MLVFYKIPKGVLYLDPYRIYGREMGHEPINLPFEIYNKCRDCLEDATYREGQLQQIFKKRFPEVAFKYSELKSLPKETLDKIGPLLSTKYRKTWKHLRKVIYIQRILRNVS